MTKIAEHEVKYDGQTYYILDFGPEINNGNGVIINSELARTPENRLVRLIWNITPSNRILGTRRKPDKVDDLEEFSETAAHKNRRK